MFRRDVPFDEFVRNSASALFLLDEAGSILDTNTTAESLLQRCASELLGRPFHSLLKPLRAMDLREAIATALSSNRAFAQVEADFDLGDSRKAAARLSLTPLATLDGRRVVMVAADDVTARRDIEEKILESRNKFRAAIDAATDWILFIDPQYRILAANKALAMHVGQSVRELWGKRCYDVFGTDSCQGCVVPSVLSMGKAAQRELFRHSAVYGSDRFLSVTASPYLDIDGRISAVVQVMRDITEETRRQEAHDELKRLSKLKDDFLASVSHELRTPLTAIRTMAELLLAHPDEDAATRREFLEIVLRESERLSRLINDVLDFSRFKAGKAKWSYRELDLRNIVSGVASLFAPQAREKGVAIIEQLPEQEVLLIADRDKIEQVLTNLASNALKFTPGGGKITIAAENVPSQPAMVRLRVADTGVGIAARDLDSIFEEFTQVGNTASGKPSGTGLGLPICKHIVEHHGGRIWAESEGGKGSTFFAEVPVQPPVVFEEERDDL